MKNKIQPKLFLWSVLILFILIPFNVQASTPHTESLYYVERVADIYTGNGDSDPRNFVEVNGVLYFSAESKNDGRELWRYDPYSDETTQITDININGSSDPSWLTVYNNKLYFAATDDVNGRQLWELNTSTGILTRVVNFNATPPITGDPQWLHIFNNELYFSADESTGRELFAYELNNGTIREVKDINPTGTSDPALIFSFENQLYFVADDGTHGKEPWVSDGTTPGTNMIRDIFPGIEGSDPGTVNVVDKEVFFSATAPGLGREMWRTDGTYANTKLVKDFYPGSESGDPGWSNRLGYNLIFFPAEDDQVGNEIWRFDPQNGVQLMADINPGIDSSDPFAVGDTGGWTMFFSADDGALGVELWKADPPYTQANLLIDIWDGKDSSEPKTLANLGSTLFFTAKDGVHGEEIWMTQAPYLSAELVADINPGIGGSVPVRQIDGYSGTITESITIGWTIYFAADDGRRGIELWKMNTAIPGKLPETGFTPAEVAAFNPDLAQGVYLSAGEIQLEIPALGQMLEVVGVPAESGQWDTQWLGNQQAGYLNGTAFPTMSGNTAISAHVVNASGLPGPFYDLKDLQWGDQILIYAWGQTYVYEVRENFRVSPDNMNILSHKDDDWLTLITCSDYSWWLQDYLKRQVIQAVLVTVK